MIGSRLRTAGDYRTSVPGLSAYRAMAGAGLDPDGPSGGLRPGGSRLRRFLRRPFLDFPLLVGFGRSSLRYGAHVSASVSHLARSRGV